MFKYEHLCDFPINLPLNKSNMGKVSYNMCLTSSLHSVPYLFTQRSLCQRSIIVERCGGECVVGGVSFAGAHSRRTLLGGGVIIC